MPQTHPPVTLPNTEVRIIYSSNAEKKFKIFIRLPPNHAESDTTYPTLYLLDANAHFSAVTGLIPRLIMAQEIPEMIIVGIGYPTEDLWDIGVARWQDFTPTQDTEADKNAEEKYKNIKQMTVSSGGGENFLNFIQQELIPFIDTEYQTEPADRTIIGHSFGGLFALYSLFQQPEIFNRYIVSSPSLWWDNHAMFMHEDQFAQDHNQLPVQLFLSVGALEEDTETQMVSNVYKFTALLKSRNYEGLEMEMIHFDNETHITVATISISRGLRAVFRKDDRSNNTQ